ncbi:MAG TPA: hypothetical protein VEY30_01960 [Myxococcaceae bacterium]|nr:hypothetical protein [Myxococcaceae bacterium]
MKKTLLARDIVAKLYSTEGSVDAASVDAARLLTALLEARSELGLSATVGDEALTKLTEAMTALGEARAAMVSVHHELKAIHDALGIRGVAMAGKVIVLSQEPEQVAA